MKLKTVLILAFICSLSFTFISEAQTEFPKREIRAVWVATVRNIDWPSRSGLPVEEQKRELIEMLDQHKKNGLNVIVYQVRPACDAMYYSKLEPWAQWITGIQGKAPDPYYDPLKMIIEECHKRNMELHAWFNPFRAVSGYKNFKLDSSHIAVKHPEMIISYGDNKHLNPGLPETRVYVSSVIADVVRRYDIDAVHMDDYFYPYKIAGELFADHEAFIKYQGDFSSEEIDDWRRHNVNLAIQQIQDSIKSLKSWVRFGISPMGVWRNRSVDPEGSDTQTNQTCYDDLYADILKWVRNGWIDYVAPQAYRQIGYEIADHKKIAEWWDTNSYGINLYMGHGVHRLNKNSDDMAWQSSEEIVRQLKLARSLPNISGDFYFSSKVFMKDPVGINKTLQEKIYPYPALIPINSAIPGNKPEPPLNLEVLTDRDNYKLKWEHNTEPGTYYVVYCFKGKVKGKLDDPANICAITNFKKYELKKQPFYRKKKYKYIVTSVSRTHHESEPSEMLTTRY